MHERCPSHFLLKKGYRVRGSCSSLSSFKQQNHENHYWLKGNSSVNGCVDIWLPGSDFVNACQDLPKLAQQRIGSKDNVFPPEGESTGPEKIGKSPTLTSSLLVSCL